MQFNPLRPSGIICDIDMRELLMILIWETSLKIAWANTKIPTIFIEFKYTCSKYKVFKLALFITMRLLNNSTYFLSKLP